MVWIDVKKGKISSSPFAGGREAELHISVDFAERAAAPTWTSFPCVVHVPHDVEDRRAYLPDHPAVFSDGTSLFSFPSNIQVQVGEDKFEGSVIRSSLKKGGYPATVFLSTGWTGPRPTVFLAVHGGQRQAWY